MVQEYITITQKDFLFNAGICGFIKVLQCENFDLEEQDVGNTIQVPVKMLEKFHDNYIKTMLNCFQDDTLYQSLIQQYEQFRRKKPTEISTVDYEKFVGKLTDKLTSASYKSGYHIISKKGDTYDILSSVKVFKGEKDIIKSMDICQELIQYMVRNGETLCMKDIIYTKIHMFWQGIAFLNRSNSKKDIKECYYNYFVKPALEYLKKKNKGTMQCIQCGNSINSTIGKAMAWLNDVGIDMARKRSHYWNFKPDTYICPICALIYSCVPLGFSIVGSDAIFINNNESIHELVSENNIFQRGGEKYNTLNQLYYKVLYSFIDESNQEQTKEIQNIQIIKRLPKGRDSWKYVFNNLSKPLLEILQVCKNNFRHLLNWSFKDKDDYANVYQEVADNFFSGNNQYPLVHTVLQKVFTENLRAPYVKDILTIQRRRMRRFYSGYEGGSSVMYVSKKEFDTAYNEGTKIRKKYGETITEKKNKNTKINDSLRSFVYPILLSLKTKDKAKFNDTMFRFYVGRSESIPKILIDMQQNDEKFQMLGYTFVAGLQGENYESEKKPENTIIEEVKKS